MSNETSAIRHNEEKRRYELEVDGKVAILEYYDGGGVRYYTHTDVPHALEGQGIGSKLAKAVLDEAQSEGLTIVPLCPFVRAYIERHPEYKPLVKY